MLSIANIEKESVLIFSLAYIDSVNELGGWFFENGRENHNPGKLLGAWLRHSELVHYFGDRRRL